MDAATTSRPRFKSSIEAIAEPSDGLLLLSENGQVWMPKRIYAALAPLLDGEHEVETIFSTLSDEFDSAEVFAALDELRRKDYLARDDVALRRPLRAFWEAAGVAPAVAERRLLETPVAVLSFGAVDVAPLNAMLVENGVRIASEAKHALVVCDDYLRPELADWNTRALAEDSSWLLFKPTGIRTFLGPGFGTADSGCWECLAQRMRWHRRIERYIAARRGGLGGAPQAFTSATLGAAYAEATTELVRWIGVGGPSVFFNTIVTTNRLTHERESHHLVRRPQCPGCGTEISALAKSAAPIALTSRPKRDTKGGGHRAVPTAEIASQLERHVSDLTGLVGTLEPGTRSGTVGEDGQWWTPTYSADHNFSDAHEEGFFLREGLRRRSGGKGKSPLQAKVSAIAESLERYSGVFDGTEPRIRSTRRGLGPAALHPNRCMNYSAVQYRTRAERNERAHKAHFVPHPFDDDTPIEWTPLWSLTARCERFLPTSFCYFGYRSDDPVFARADSNGCAAGAVFEEAVLQGLLELIERDAVAIWWYNRIARPGIDLASAQDPYATNLSAHYHSLGREVWALDITSDFGVPVFAALSRRVDKAEEDIIYGFGCHLDPQVALNRALTEMNQSLEAVPAADAATTDRGALTYRGGPDAVSWWRTVKAGDEAFLSPCDTSPRALSTVQSFATDDLLTDIEHLVARANALSVEVLVLDQTRPDVGLPVVRVVAPGLRHFWARFGPGRLYDVPVRLGWLPHALEEAQLNPHVVQF